MWNDPLRRRFEKEHWTSLERQAQATHREMERLVQVISQARRSVRNFQENKPPKIMG